MNLLGALALSALLSGCVAAVIPVVAAGTIARKKAAKAKAKPQPAPENPAPENPAAEIPVPVTVATAASGTQAAMAEAFPQAGQIDGAYSAFLRFALTNAALRQTGYAVSSVALTGSFALEHPTFLPCDELPTAVIIDLDEAHANDTDGTSSVLPKPSAIDLKGLAAGLERLRGNGVSIIWMSERPTEEQETLLDTLKDGGLVTGDRDTLYLTGSGDYRKQTRRIEAASKSCVIAMAGDRKSDFEELFDYLRKPEAAYRLDPLFDAGWFLVPTPIPPASLAAQTNEDTNALDPR